MKSIKTIIGAALSFGLLTACNGNGSGTQALEYLAVQFEKGDSWSIIDKDGKVVVKEEYSPDDKISLISPEGAYWVKSGEKLQLYNIKNPKKAVSDTEYDAATEFAAGRSVVSVQGKPLQVIDTGGKVIATLPKEMTVVLGYAPCGLARFAKEAESKMGCIDRSGKVVFEDEYIDISQFNGGLANAVKKEFTGYDIYDGNGKRVGQFPRGSYELFTTENGGNLLAARKVDAGENEPMVFLDTDGKRVFSVKHSDGSRWENVYSVFRDGYSVFANKEGMMGIVNDKGEEMVRPKYDWLHNFGGGWFGVRKGDKRGIISAEDETIADFDYEDFLNSMMGNNFVLKQDGYWYLIGPDGKEVSKDGFVSIALSPCSYGVTYVDIETLAGLFVDEIEGFDPTVTPEKLAKTKLDKDEPEYQDQYHVYMEYKTSLGKDLMAEYSCRFEETLAVEKTHQETTNDGWFTSTHTVYDGLGWNNSPLGGFYMKVDLSSKNVSCKSVCEAISGSLKGKGYTDEGEGWMSKQVKGKTMRIKAEEDSSGNTINVFGQIS